MAQVSLLQFGALARQPRQHLARVVVQRGLARDVAVELGKARRQRGKGVAGTRLGLVQGLGLGSSACPDGGGDAFLLAQGGKGGLGISSGAGGRTGGGLGLRRRRAGLGQRRKRRCQGGLRLGPAAPDQGPLGLAQRRADLAVARGGAGLARQRGGLRRKLFQPVVHAGQVLLGPVQAQLGLVPALVKPADACRILQHPPARLGAGVDQLGDLSLPDQRGRLRPGRGIREQHLHVARPHLAPVEAISRARVARDPPRDLQRVAVVEADGRAAGAVVQGQRHLGRGARGAAGGAREDHVLHPLAAHGGGAAFAHDPAQRFQQVGLAAAVGADHARQPVADDQLGRVHEAFEAGQAKAVELHGKALAACSGAIQPLRAGKSTRRLSRSAKTGALPKRGARANDAAWSRRLSPS